MILEIVGGIGIFCFGALYGLMAERHNWKVWLKRNYPKIYQECGGDRAY